MAKKESGHAGRKRRREARAQALAAQATRAASGDLTAGLERLAAIGPPPADVEARLPWVSKVLAELLHQTINDPAIDEDKRRSQAATLADKLGKTHPRALLEEKVRRISDQLRVETQPRSIQWAKGDAIMKSPNARGMRRGPRAIPPSAIDDTPTPSIDDHDKGLA